MKQIKNLTLFLISALLFSCADGFVDTEPTNSFTPSGQLVVDESSAQSAINGIYDALQSDYLYGGYDIYMTALWADDLSHSGSFPTFAELVGNDPALSNGSILSYWNGQYAAIYRANRVINEVPNINVTQERKDVFIAEARAIRALCYYKLVKVFGGVPLEKNAYSNTDDIDRNPVARSTVSEVYDFILSDVGFAVEKLGSGTYYKFNENAARVLKAKVEMELQRYGDAETTLAPVLTAGYKLASNYSDLFANIGFGDPIVANRDETILAIDFVDTDGGTQGFFFRRAGRREVAPSTSLVDAFESGDVRKAFITSGGEIGKYFDAGNGGDDAYVFRYADVLLMQAELLARKGEYTQASNYINQVRTRAGLADVTLDATNYIDLIAKERRVELFGEGSDRLFTITRLGLADDILSNKPNSTYIAARNNLWPIPQQEIERNSAISISDQNPGY